jgi:hypothetical protein
MRRKQGLYLDIRSNGNKIIGRVYDSSNDKKDTFRGTTRKELLKKFRSSYNPDPSIVFNKRGRTDF